MASQLREGPPPSMQFVSSGHASHAYQIRPLRASDAAAVRQICCDTGCLGQPVAPLCSDEELFASLVVEPYLEYAQDWGFVAEQDHQIVGYLLGAPPGFDASVFRVAAQATLKMLARAATGNYRDHPQTLQFLHWLLFRSYGERPLRPVHAAHMHFNVRSPERGHFLGLHLWQRFETLLRDRGISHYYGELFSWPGHRPERPYRRYGLQVYDRVSTSLFDSVCDLDIENICVYKRIV
ncbi:hypothetical protein AB4090_14045 [Acidithiobacillus sp. IBUN Pt1247-S3]|uniref:hypothetical protein n=1 Tax=Acidithiobacillus sp. IBUN Pt1247-S3 TaxID=3166642 RepID=UPI0034E3D912